MKKRKEELITDFLGRPVGRYHRREENGEEEIEVTDYFGRKEGKTKESRGTVNFFGKIIYTDEVPATLLPKKKDNKKFIEAAEKRYNVFKGELEKRVESYRNVTIKSQGYMTNEEVVENQKLERQEREKVRQSQLDRRILEQMRNELDDLKRWR